MMPMSTFGSWSMLAFIGTIVVTLVLLAFDKLDEKYWEDIEK